MPPQRIALPRPGVPADRGLAALGLIMQLVGRTGGALAVLYLSTLAFIDARHDHPVAELLIVASCVWRGYLHARAGRRLLYAHSDQPPLPTLLAYAQFALVQAIAIGLTTWLLFDIHGVRALGIAGAAALWPLVLLILIGTVARVPREVPLGEDRGLEGASVVMMVLGACGVMAAGALLIARAALDDDHIRHGWSSLIVFVAVMVLVTSLLLLRAGRAGAPAVSFDVPLVRLDHYAAFGGVTAVCVAPCLLMVGLREHVALVGLVAALLGGWLMFAWPSLLRRFFQHRQFVEMLDGPRVQHVRAPDAGSTALGWLLAGHAATTASAVLLMVMVGNGFLARRLWGLEPALGGFVTPLWATLVVAAVELACAIALLQVRAHRRLIATLYAALAVATTLMHAWRTLSELGASWFALGDAMSLVAVAIQLAIPVATLVLVHRAVAPAAVARYRQPHEK